MSKTELLASLLYRSGLLAHSHTSPQRQRSFSRITEFDRIGSERNLYCTILCLVPHRSISKDR